MTACKSSRLLPVTRMASPWIWVVTLSLVSRMKPVTCLATGVSRPCLILMTCRAWPSGEMSGSPFSTLLRLICALGELAHDHFHERADAEFVLRRQFDFIFLQLDFGVAALEIKAVGEFLFGLVDGVLDFHRVDLRNNVE